ncbi:MAG: hypothetical protein SYC29_13575 [Planctomycetota bacterium]|nr:hypothetical protein [Planctomycetota bacterium]
MSPYQVFALLLSASLSMWASPSALADTVHVPEDYPTIQAAIDACVDGDEVVVADDTYTGWGNTGINFGGRLITLRSASGDPDLCIIDCQSTARGFFFVNGETADAIVDGFTIRGGFATNNGAGLSISGASPAIRNCIIEECNSSMSGGGASVSGGSPSFDDCAFNVNFASDDGGAVHCYNASPAFDGCIFDENTASNRGGALFNASSDDVTMSATSFSNNLAGSQGGAIYHSRLGDAGTLWLDGCTFTGNHLTVGAGGSGGALSVEEGELAIENSHFNSNFAIVDAGAILATASTLTVTNTEFIGNSASGQGGALSLTGGNTTLTQCTFGGNEVETLNDDEGGGAIKNEGGLLTLTDCVLVSNIAPRFGGAVANTGELVLINSTFSENAIMLDTDYSGGGAIHSTNNGVTCADGCTFSSNSAFNFGGAVFGDSDTTTHITDSTFIDNQSFAEIYGVGGAIHSDGVLSVEHTRFQENVCSHLGGAVSGNGDFVSCTFISNTAGTSGGALFNQWAVNYGLRLINCRFVGNQCAKYGGGAILDAGKCDFFEMVGCDFVGNKVTDPDGVLYGGGLCLDSYYDLVRIVNCTFWANSAPQGGGAFIGAAWEGSAELYNCVFRGNTPNQINDDPDISILYSNIEGGWSGPGSNNIDADPLFIDPDGLDDIPGTEDDNLRLLPLSPCIDAADNTAVPPDEFDLDGDGDTNEPIPFDLDGDDRFVDDPATEDTGHGTPPVVDMGAYEFQACPADFDHDDDVDTADLLFLLGAWGTAAGDTDYDGDTDTADLLTLLGTWGECP